LRAPASIDERVQARELLAAQWRADLRAMDLRARSQFFLCERAAREIAREAQYLLDRWRAWLLEQLRQDFAALDTEQHQIGQLNKRMSQAVEALELSLST